jgi:hypothetical protein
MRNSLLMQKNLLNKNESMQVFASDKEKKDENSFIFIVLCSVFFFNFLWKIMVS